MPILINLFYIYILCYRLSMVCLLQQVVVQVETNNSNIILTQLLPDYQPLGRLLQARKTYRYKLYKLMHMCKLEGALKLHPDRQYGRQDKG